MDISWSNAKECLVGFQILWSCRRRSQERMRTGGHLLPFHIGAAGCFICHCVPWTSEGGQVLSGPKRRPLKSPKVCMGSLTFSCSCRAYPYVQFYTECTHVFWFISYCGGWTEVLWWQLGSTPWVRCRHHHHWNRLGAFCWPHRCRYLSLSILRLQFTRAQFNLHDFATDS